MHQAFATPQSRQLFFTSHTLLQPRASLSFLSNYFFPSRQNNNLYLEFLLFWDLGLNVDLFSGIPRSLFKEAKVCRDKIHYEIAVRTLSPTMCF